MRVGWIGAGRMGSPMAQRAARAGHAVRIHALQVADKAGLRDAGATIVATAEEAVRAAELVCVAVFDDGQARQAMLGPEGALRHMAPGAILAIHTSGSPKLARDLAAAAPSGVRVIDAPFSGQQEQLSKGALTLLVGGDRDAFEAACEVFSAYAREIAHVGGLGDAQTVKLVNQFLFRANLAAADVALRILETRGLDRAAVVPAMMGCSGASWALGSLAQGPDMAERARGLKPYFDVYLAAAAEDGLPIESLFRRGESEPETGA